MLAGTGNMSTSHLPGHSTVQSSGRRIVPPSVQVVLTAPPLPGVVARKRRRSLKPVMVTLGVLALVAGAGWIGWRIIQANQRLSAKQALINRMELAQQDALRANGWEGGDMVNGVNYVVTSPRSDDPFIAEFTQSLKSKVGVLVVMVNNQHTQSAHTLDVALATVHLRDGSTHTGPDRQSLLRACANPAAVDAYPGVYQVPAGNWHGGSRSLFRRMWM